MYSIDTEGTHILLVKISETTDFSILEGESENAFK